MNGDLGKLFRPRSVAIIGASQDLKQRGSRPLQFLPKHGFQGNLFPVNPKYKEIAGLRCYPSVLDIPEPVDLAMVTIPGKLVFATLEQCGKKGIPMAVIRSAGFADAGSEGKDKQRRLKEIAQGYNMRFMGPSSLGFVNVHDQIAAYFHMAGNMPGFPPGTVGLVSQSGGLSGAIANLLVDRGVGLSYVVSTGSEGDLNVSEILEMLVEDRNTKVVAAVIEGFQDPMKFQNVAEYAIKNSKPLVVLKVGRTETGRKAALSHTGIMSGSYNTFKEICREYGVTLVKDVNELCNTIKLFEQCVIPGGKKVGIITSSGGMKTILADAASELDLDLPRPSPGLGTELRNILPEYSTLDNPMDITGGLSEEVFEKCLSIFAADEKFDLIVVPVTLLGPEASKKRAYNIYEVSQRLNKPIVGVWVGGSLIDEGRMTATRIGMPFFEDTIGCLNGVKALSNYGETVNRWASQGNDDQDLLPAELTSAAENLIKQIKLTRQVNEVEARELLNHYGVPTASEILVNNITGAINAADKIGYPVALKIISPDLHHKSDKGGVILNIKDGDELAKAFLILQSVVQTLGDKDGSCGYLVQEMVPCSTELIIGASRDNEFGPFITFGMGGIFVELYHDVSLRRVPVLPEEAKRMIQEVKASRILSGYRGRPTVDTDSLAGLIGKVSRMVSDLGDSFQELDINPLVVTPSGEVKAVDALLILSTK